MTAFQRIIMPIAYEFNPELVLVLVDFDAIGEPMRMGNVSPECYGYFTHWLSALANGRIIICMKGDYKCHSVSNAMVTCVKALLGDPLPMLTSRMAASLNNIQAIQNVISVQQKYWKSLKFSKMLPALNVSKRDIDE